MERALTPTYAAQPMLSLLLLSLTTLAAAGSPLPVQAPPAAEQPAEALSFQTHALRFDWTRDAALTAGVGALALSTELFFKDALAAETCRWCDRNAQGEDTLNALDQWGLGIQGSPHAQSISGTWSNVMSVAILPASVLGTGYLVAHGSGASGAQLGEDALMVAQVVLFATVTNQAAKFAFARERPFVHQLPPEERANTEKPEDNNLSFYSGHSSFGFALVTATGTVAQLRGYRNAGWIWAVGLPLATSVPLLRMGAGKHYLTDVAVGALMGSAFGVAIPRLLHPRTGDTRGASATGLDLRLHVGPRSVALSGAF